MRCRLKSPVMMSSEDEVMKSSSNVENSEMKTGFEEFGGRYTLSRMKGEEVGEKGMVVKEGETVKERH